MASKPNKHYAVEAARHAAAWRPGTAEFAARVGYPTAPVPPCADDSCLNRAGGAAAPIETYWLCPLCCKAVPSCATHHTHAPAKVSAPPFKRRAADAAAYRAWLAVRPFRQKLKSSA